MHRVAVSLSGLLALSAAFLATGSPAFAMRVAPVGGGPSANFAPVVHHAAGLSSWQVAAIVIAGVVVMVAAMLGTMLIRSSRRIASAPANT
jgi:hypothetical protein